MAAIIRKIRIGAGSLSRFCSFGAENGNITTKASFAVYAQPSSSSARLFASGESFAPHVAGVNADGAWIHIYGIRDF